MMSGGQTNTTQNGDNRQQDDQEEQQIQQTNVVSEGASFQYIEDDQEDKKPVFQDKFQHRYEAEMQNHLTQGAELDPNNGSIIRKAKRIDKIGAKGRAGNIALDVDRPVLPVVTFTTLKDSLLDQDFDSQTLGKPDMHFLDVEQDEAQDQDTVIMASYPRSGNTLLRAYLEKIMGLTSGSDCDITKKLNKDLMLMGLAGEGLVDKRVWIVKTHYPERYGKTKFYAERTILLVRNPLDCVTSLFNMVCTGSHNRSIHDLDFAKFNDHWSEFIEQEITIWKDFHDFWLSASKAPIHIIRYEDIVHHPKEALLSLVQFILNKDDLSGTRLQHFIDIAVHEASPQIYKPREGKVNGNIAKFTSDQLEYMYQQGKELIDRFNYTHIFTKQDVFSNELNQVQPKQLPKYSSPFILEYNQKAFAKSLYNASLDEIYSIYINFPALLLRKKSVQYPEGRTSLRFKNALRRRVTIIDKNQNRIDQNQVKNIDNTEVDEAEKEIQ